jgi:two-component system OmpR family sensor kinase
MSLRLRLVLVTMSVVVGALVAADLAAYVALRSFLMARAGDQLVAATGQVFKLSQDRSLGSADIVAQLEIGKAQTGAYAVYDASGSMLANIAAARSSKQVLPLPQYPSFEAIARTKVQKGSNTEPLVVPSTTIPASAGGFDYLATSFTTSDGGLIVVAYPLDEVADTLGQLGAIELLVTALVLVIVLLISSRLVRVALRPLTAIEDTATRISEGELARRVKTVDPRTEVGRLGLAFNTMVTRLEAALVARERSEQRLRQLVTDASHELRTPLTSIRGYAELFRRGADRRPPDLARAMNGIEAESERMGRLVDELLTLARLDEGQGMPPGDADLVPVVRDAVEAALATEPDRRISLALPPTALVLADAGRLRQVIDNLLANVRVHTAPGTPARVSVAEDAANWVLEVADDGPGMTEDARLRAFERFYRADPSRSRDSGGSGLGLAIVAAIAQAYGGEVAVDSAPGHGARFRISLPRTDRPAIPTATSTHVHSR